MTTLENSYCVPRTVEEWVECVPWLKDDPMAKPPNDLSKCAFVAYGDGTIAKEPKEGMVELPVPRFLDLIHDRIVLWRLEEIGWNFVDCKFPYHEFKPNKGVTLSWSEKTQNAGVGFELAHDSTWLNITTFTDLMTLIRFLTPPSND